jgi:hypothetical protein
MDLKSEAWNTSRRSIQLVQRYEIHLWDSGIFGRTPIPKVAPQGAD